MSRSILSSKGLIPVYLILAVVIVGLAIFGGSQLAGGEEASDRYGRGLPLSRQGSVRPQAGSGEAGAGSRNLQDCCQRPQLVEGGRKHHEVPDPVGRDG